jgi:hypothetical protein
MVAFDDQQKQVLRMLPDGMLEISALACHSMGSRLMPSGSAILSRKVTRQ